MSLDADARVFDLTVNGRPHQVTVHEDTPLVYVLRNDLGLKGTRFGCGAEACGACTVHVDGKLVYACTTPVHAVAGAAIVTVEGLDASKAGTRLRSALLDGQAGQCGYCLAGILMTATALFEKNDHPTTPEIAEALDRNLCRCGSHGRLLRAFSRVADAP